MAENGDNKNQPKAEELQKQLEIFEKQRDEYLEGWKRAKADFINYKKEEVERFSLLAKFGNESLIREILSVLDSFDLGLAVLKGYKESEKGFFMIKNQLEEVLKNYGLEKIKVQIGDKFDPVCHEAAGEVDSEKPVGTIAEEIGKGYLLNGKVIRPAKVKLSKGQS